MSSQRNTTVIPVSNRVFLEANFGENWEKSHLASLDTLSDHGAWMGGPGKWMEPLCIPARNNYAAVSTMKDGRRKLDKVEDIHVIVLDDVGTKADPAKIEALLGNSSWITETSPSNYQWGYILETPEPDVRKFAAIAEKLKEMHMADKNTLDATRYFRLPVGSNTKDEHVQKNGGQPWQVRLVHWEPTKKFKIEDMARDLGADLSNDALLNHSLKQASASSGTANIRQPDEWLDALFDLCMAKREGNNGVVHITCPWEHEHTANPGDGTAYLGNGNFRCHHSCHAKGRRTPQFQEEFKRLIGEAHGRPGENVLASKVFRRQSFDPAQTTALAKRFADARQTELQHKFLGRFTFCHSMEKYVDRTTGMLLSPASFNRVNAHIIPYGTRGKASADAVFINEGGEQVALATYRPGQPDIVQDENDKGVLVPAVNLWRGGGLTPDLTASHADVQPFLEHAEFIIPDPEAKGVALDFMAFILQNPGAKINWALTLGGEMRTGKDTLFEPLIAGIGQHNIGRVKPSMLKEPFTSWLKNQVIFFDEMSTVDRVDTYNELKTKIAAPPDKVLVNEKFVPAYYVPNIQNYIILTNKEDAVAIEPGDGRYYVYWSPAQPKDRAYYDALYGWFEQGGLAQAVGWLMRRDVSTFTPKTCPAWTTSKTAMMRASLPAAGAWVASQFDSDGLFAGRKLISVSEILAAGSARSAGGVVVNSITTKGIAKALKAMGGDTLHGGNPVSLPSGERVRIWAVERPELYRQLSLDQLRDAYQAERIKPLAALPL